MQNPLFVGSSTPNLAGESHQLEELGPPERKLNGNVKSASEVDVTELGRDYAVNGDPAINTEHTRPSFHEFAVSCTLHGLPIVADRKNSSLRRALWLVVLIVSCGLMSFLLYESVKTYLDREVSTKVTLKYVNEVRLPAVTICNFNQFLWKKIGQVAAKRVVLALVQPDPTQQLQWEDVVQALPYTFRHDCDKWHTTTGLERCLSAVLNFQSRRTGRSIPFPPPVSLPANLPVSVPEIPRLTLPPSIANRTGNILTNNTINRNISVNASGINNKTGIDLTNWLLGNKNNSISGVNVTELAEEISKVSLEQFYLQNGHNILTMLKSCTFRGVNCTAKDFKHIFTPYGNCYTFNSNQTLFVRQPGVGHGLDMTLDVEQEQYVPGDRNLPAGFRLQVHSAADTPSVDTLGFAVAPGAAAYIATQLQRVKNLPKPYGDCAPDAKLAYFKTYTLTNCFLECLTVETVKACKCRAVYMPNDSVDGHPPTRFCNALEMTNCVASIRRRIQTDTLSCRCQPPCRYETYSHSLSTALFPSDNSLLRNYDGTNPKSLLGIVGDSLSEYLGVVNRRNLVHISIYFEEINYQDAEQIKLYDEIKLVGDVGGIAGVLLGASALTILEFADFLGNIFMFFGRNFRKSMQERIRRFHERQSRGPCLQEKKASSIKRTGFWPRRVSASSVKQNNVLLSS